MEEQTLLLQSLRITEEVDPMPGFYARVVERIDRQRPASFWDLLVNPLFNRQLAAASLALLLLLGVYVVQNGVLDSPNIPARIIAVENKDAHMLGTNPKRDRNVVLVNLVTYTD